MFLAYGFALGLIAALALYLHLRPADLLSTERPMPNAASTPQSSSDSEEEPAENLAPAAAPATAQDSPPPKPAPVDKEYDFYDVLPDFEVVVSDENAQPITRQPSATRPSERSITRPDKPATYILQAGSFRKFVDADRRKAELAFKGIESNIQQVVLKEEEIWYRVYVGPDSDFAALERMRSELRRANIDVLILKVHQ